MNRVEIEINDLIEFYYREAEEGGNGATVADICIEVAQRLSNFKKTLRNEGCIEGIEETINQ